MNEERKSDPATEPPPDTDPAPPGYPPPPSSDPELGPEEMRKRMLKADFEMGQQQHLRIPRGLQK